MIWLAEAAMWSALLVSAWNAGMIGSRWRSGSRLTRLAETTLLAAAVSGVVAWATMAGLLFSGAAPSLLAPLPPVDVGPGYRVAALWATWQGGVLTAGVSMQVLAAFAPSLDRVGARVPLRAAGLLSVAALAALASFIAPSLSGGAATPPDAVPAWMQSPAASAAALAAVVGVTALAGAFGIAIAAGGMRSEAVFRSLVIVAWAAATVALAAEQAARSRLGVGPQDAVVLGSASGGLALWLAAGALLHRRLRTLVLQSLIRGRSGGGPEPATAVPDLRRIGGLAGHLGAVLVAASFGAHVLAARATLALAPGEAVEARDAFGRVWRVVNQGVSRFDGPGADHTAVAIEATGPDGAAHLLTTERLEYVGSESQHVGAPAGTRGSLAFPMQTLRVLLERVEGGDVAQVRIAFVPLLALWPAGLGFVGLSVVLLAVSPRQRTPASSRT